MQKANPLTSRVSLLLIAIALMGASCIPNGSSSGLVSTFPKEKLTLNVWMPVDAASTFSNTELSYQSRHPNVSFNFKSFPDQQSYQTALLSALATGNGPDIAVFGNDQTAYYKDKMVPVPDLYFNGVQPVTAVSSKYAPAVTTDAVADGKVYGLPLYTDTLSLYVNQSLVNTSFSDLITAGVHFDTSLLTLPPNTWDQLVGATKLLTKKDGSTITQSGMALGTTTNIPYAADIIAALMLQQGATMVNADRTSATFHVADINNPTFYPGSAALNFLHGFVDPGSPYYSWNATMPDAKQAFLDGKVAMMLDYSSLAPYLKARNPKLNFQTAPLPQITNTLHVTDYARYQLIGVTNNSKYPQVAWDFVQNYMNGGGQQAFLALTGEQSPDRSGDAATNNTQRIGVSNPYYLQVPTAQSWFKGKNPSAADKALTTALDQVDQGINIQTALNTAAQTVTQLLQHPTDIPPVQGAI